MGVKFTNHTDYLLGIASMTFRNTENGAVEYWTDKVTDLDDQQSHNDVIIRAGMLNPIAAIIPTESDFQITANTAAFSLKMQMMQLGGSYGGNGIIPKCQNVTASAAAISIDVTGGTPVAAPGYTEIFCNVQEIGAAGTIEGTGSVYPLNPSTGAVSGFTATVGKKYKVWYWVNDATAHKGVVYGAIQPGIYNVTVQQPIFRNTSGEANKGTRVGWLYRVFPLYQLAGSAGSAGNQTTNGNTNLSGRALTFTDKVVSESCEDETGVSAYYFAVYDESAEDIQGLALVGGVLNVPKSTTKTITEFKLVMADGSLASPDPAFMSYELTSAPSGTSVSGSVLTAGATTGECDITATYNDGTNTFVCEGVLSVN